MKKHEQAQESYSEESGDQLRCALCKRRFSDAKVLPCLHTFCRRCLEEYVHSRQCLHCPTCGQDVLYTEQKPSTGQITHAKERSMSPMSLVACIEQLPSNFFIGSILDVVSPDESDDEGIIALESFKDKKRICNSCDDISNASSKCQECNDFLCDNCVMAHLRVRLTKEHHITRYPDISESLEKLHISPITPTTSPQTLIVLNSPIKTVPSTSSSMGPGPSGVTLSTMSTAAGDRNVSFCSVHCSEVVTLFCDTCSQPSCGKCTMENHIGHNFIYMQDAVANAKSLTYKLLADARAGIKAIEESLQRANITTNRIEAQVQQVSSDIRETTSRHRLALDNREIDLLHRLDNIRQVKGQSLSMQMDELKHGLGRLTATVESARISLESGNDIDILNTKACYEQPIEEY